MSVNYPPIPSGPFAVGDFAPWFRLPADNRPDFNFSTLAGQRTLLFFYGSARVPQVGAALSQLAKTAAGRLQDLGVVVVGVSVDAQERQHFTAHPPRWMRVLFDLDRSVSRQYGICQGDESYSPVAFLLDETLRIAAILPLHDPLRLAAEAAVAAERLPAVRPARPAVPQAPVLLIPNVLDAAACETLIAHYEQTGGEPSGFMEEKNGLTRGVLDSNFKRRRDVLLSEPALLQMVNRQIQRRIVPEVSKVFQFRISRFERHLIACYEGEQGGLFRAHRDNTTRGTAHRRFAMSLNLNEGAYEGGQLRFPEYGNALFRPRTGEAVIFSCSLQHEALPVTSGRRFALLSFFYDEAAVQVRQENLRFVEKEEAARAGAA
jgi:peroxiredoxin/predicted 2-oxoglutarate/Fe(II)-dependent dioxygenase YbiX